MATRVDCPARPEMKSTSLGSEVQDVRFHLVRAPTNSASGLSGASMGSACPDRP